MSQPFKWGVYTFLYPTPNNNVEIVNSSGTRFWIMPEALIAFAAHAVRQEKINALEVATDREILGLKP